MATMEAAAHSFCEVCGDVGGASALVICENVDAGCLGGRHCYCFRPVRTEVPQDEWYCQECESARRAAARKREQAAAAAAEQRRQARMLRRKQRQAEKEAAREQRREERVRERQQQKAAEKKQQQQQKAQAPRQPPLPPPPQQQPSAAPRPAPIARQPNACGGAAAAAAAAAGPARQQQASAKAFSLTQFLGGVEERARQEREKEQRERERAVAAAAEERRRAMIMDKTAGWLDPSGAHRLERERQLAERYSLSRCRGEGLVWNGQLALPLPQQGSFRAWVQCFPLPGNPACVEAAQRSLLPLAAAATSQQQPAMRIVSCPEDLGTHPRDAWHGASMLLAPSLGQAPPAAQAQWRALWDALAGQQLAVQLELPPAAEEAAAGGAGDGDASGGGSGSGSGSLLELVPNLWDPESLSLFGLLAVPFEQVALQPPAPGSATARGICKAPPALPGSPTTTPLAQLKGSSEQQQQQRQQQRRRERRPLSWADGELPDATPDHAALELDVGSHYTTPQRRARQEARPPRLPTIRSFEEEAGAQAHAPLPLEGLKVGLAGFPPTADQELRSVIDQLGRLGALPSQTAVLADVLCLYPLLVPQLELPMPKPILPLGLAHMLATSGVRVYEDRGFEVVRDLLRLQRPLQGAEWASKRLGPVYPAGLIVVLDSGLLPRMLADPLERLLAEVERLSGSAAAAQHPGCAWFVTAPREDVAQLHAAAAGGRQPAAATWQLWQGSSRARALEPDETSTRLQGEAQQPGLRNAQRCAYRRRVDCRLVYLCSEDRALIDAEQYTTVLAGDVQDLLGWLAER